MLKVDIPIIKEFFGSTNNILSYISPMKHIRVYAYKNGEMRDVIFVLTNYMDRNARKLVRNLYRHDAMKFKRNNNYVYVLMNNNRLKYFQNVIPRFENVK